MANVKITALPSVSAPPLSGTEVLEIVQSGVSNKVTASKLAAAFTTDAANILPVANGGTGRATLTGYVKGSGTTGFTAAATIPVADITGVATVAQGGTGAGTLTGYVKGTGTTAMTASATVPWADIANKPTNYGAFYDMNNQTAAINTATVMLFGTTSLVDGVTMAGGSRVTVPAAGVYNFQFSAQLVNSSAADVNVSIWIRKNGASAIADSCGDVSVPKKDGAINGYAMAAWNYMESLAAGDYIEFIWSTPSASVLIEAIAARTVPTRPAAPSIILTVEQVA